MSKGPQASTSTSELLKQKSTVIDKPSIAVEDHHAVNFIPDNETIDVDIDELKEQLGIDKILKSIDAIAEKLNQHGGAEYSGSEAPDAKSDLSLASGFDPTAPLALDITEGPSTNTITEEELILTSIFEGSESVGPEVHKIIPQRINDACSKKAMDSKLKELQEKYCNFLCVPKVNLEL